MAATRETILAFVKQHLHPRQEDWTVVESLTDEELAINYEQLQAFIREVDLQNLSSSFDTCYVCKRRVWTGVLVRQSYFLHFKGHQFPNRPKEHVTDLLCCQCLDACACLDAEKKNNRHLKYCMGCVQHYCALHNGSNGELCGDCTSTVWFGRRARELIQMYSDVPLSWEEFCSIMRHE